MMLAGCRPGMDHPRYPWTPLVHIGQAEQAPAGLVSDAKGQAGSDHNVGIAGVISAS